MYVNIIFNEMGYLRPIYKLNFNILKILAMSVHKYGTISQDNPKIKPKECFILIALRKIYNIPFPPGFRQFPSVKLVLLMVLLHRIHLYSTFNFILGLTATRGTNSTIGEDSTVTAQVFVSSALFISPLPGLIADKYVPRAKMILICFLLSFIGSSIQSIFHSLFELSVISISPYLYYSIHAIALCLLTVGSSGVYALLVPVGVDQMEGASEMRLKSYFSWHYWSINIGAGLAAGRYFIYATHKNDILTLLASSYLSTVSVFLALVVLIVSLHFGLLQRNMPPGGTPLIQVLGVTTCAVSSRYSNRGERSYYPIGLFDYALTENKGRYSYEQVQDVKTFYKIIFVLICMTWYFGVYNLLYSVYPVQAMRVSGAEDTFFANLILFFSDCSTIIIILPLFELIRWKCKFVHFSFPKILYKFQVGIFFGLLSILFALTINTSSYFQVISTVNKTNNSTSLPTLVRLPLFIPQSVLIGISECFSTVGSMEFVYAQSPHQMKGIIFGFLQCLTGLGFYFPTLIYQIMENIGSCPPVYNCTYCLVIKGECEANESMDYVYYSVYAVLTLVYFLLFLFVAKFYQRRERQRIEVWHTPRVRFVK